jgi:hypothetical protein
LLSGWVNGFQSNQSKFSFFCSWRNVCEASAFILQKQMKSISTFYLYENINECDCIYLYAYYKFYIKDCFWKRRINILKMKVKKHSVGMNCIWWAFKYVSRDFVVYVVYGGCLSWKKIDTLVKRNLILDLHVHLEIWYT